MHKKHYVLLLVFYLATTAISFGAFKLAFESGATSTIVRTKGGLAQLISPAVPKSEGGLAIDQNLPKTEVCPLSGEKFTVPEREAWEKRRPLAVMIENHVDARPQSGLSKADVVYEAMAEGGITRFMGMYLCAAQAKDTILAPVRSARQTFIDYASDYNFPLYVHVGGANGLDSDPRVRALENLTAYKWTGNNDLNQFSIGYPVFVRNYDRLQGKDLATEHTMETSTKRLWEYAETKRKITNVDRFGTDWMKTFVPWQFTEDAPEGERPASQVISYEFWEGFTQFAVRWDYDPASNTYKRTMGGEKHTDLNDGSQIAVKNVVILFTTEESPVDIHKHTYHKTSGSGKAIIFQNGKRHDVNWSKKDRTSRLLFTDVKGQPFKLVGGKIWISVVATGTPVEVI